MTESYSFIGPDVFMSKEGKLFSKKDEDTYVPIQNKYVEAEERFVQNQLKKKGRET